MPDLSFFTAPQPRELSEVLIAIGIEPPAGSEDLVIGRTAPLDVAGPDELSFVESARLLPILLKARAGAVFCAEKMQAYVPSGCLPIPVREPQRSFALATALFYPEAVRPPIVAGGPEISEGAWVDSSARLEAGVTVGPGAVIGSGVEVGRGTVIGPNAVLGRNVRIGRDGYVGPGSVVLHAFVGDRVFLHAGVKVGQDGFGYVMGRAGHAKVPQVGRVIIQDDVEVGANTTIDRGSLKDTVIGEGTKIDNLVQIAHNVSIGRHCVITAHVGISGSTVLEDFVVLAGKVGVADHLRIGAGAQVAGGSNVADSIPPGGRWVGTPARPVRRWMKEVMAISSLASGGSSSSRDRATRRLLKGDPEREDTE